MVSISTLHMTLQYAISGRTSRTAEDRIYRSKQGSTEMAAWNWVIFMACEDAQIEVGAEVVVDNAKDQ